MRDSGEPIVGNRRADRSEDAMIASGKSLRRVRFGIGCVAAAGGGALLMGLMRPAPADAYVGESFLQFPGISGTWKGKQYRNWLQVEAHYWPAEEGTFFGTRTMRTRERNYFSAPIAPRQGAGRLAIAVAKRSPALKAMMALCASKAEVGELKFAESSEWARGLAEVGPRPAGVPEYFEYRLKGVRIADCPVVDGAVDQAFVLAFQDVEWLNYAGPEHGQKIAMPAASLRPIQASGKTRAFVLSWIGDANWAADGQCPKMNVKPAEAEYFELMPPQRAAAVRAELAAKKSGVDYEQGQMARRGPSELNVGLLPGIVKDPGHIYPQSSVAIGLDLDGSDGSGKVPAGTCRHHNYDAADGRKGIDNQRFRVMGCMAGYQGRKGFLMQYRNEQMRNGLVSILLVVSGIDDERNDDNVDVTLLYSKDPMAKSADGKTMLADYTYRLTEKPELLYYPRVLPARIVDGVVETRPVDQFRMNTGLGPELNLFQSRMRIELRADGSMKGLVAGYQDWRKDMMLNGNSNAEQLYGFRAPGLYYALRREADGLKDPVTGQCNGISAAYEMEGSAAFIPPSTFRRLAERGGVADGRAR